MEVDEGMGLFGDRGVFCDHELDGEPGISTRAYRSFADSAIATGVCSINRKGPEDRRGERRGMYGYSWR